MTIAHPEAAGWVPLPGGIAQAEAGLGQPLLRLVGGTPEAATLWPNDVRHMNGATLRGPLPSVWLCYDYGTDSALRVATVTESSGLLHGNSERDTISIGTCISATEKPAPWPDDSWHDSDAPNQNPIVIDGVAHEATSFWLGPELLVRTACVDGAVVALSGRPSAVQSARLTWTTP